MLLVLSLRRGLACLNSNSTKTPKHWALVIPALPSRIPPRFLSVHPSEDSAAFSLLVETLRFTPETARSLCRKLQSKNPKNAGAVLSFLKDRGFSADEISEMVRRCPRVLENHPQKTLLPKLEFLESKGLLGPDLAEYLSSNPHILRRSLERSIIPQFNLFRNILRSDSKALRAIRRTYRAASHDVNFASNMRYLLDSGVSESNVASLLQHTPFMLCNSQARITEAMRVLNDMGFDPDKSAFVHALMAVLGMSKSSWESKARFYRKWGWSEAELLSAFRKWPHCMKVSEDKINGVMSLLVGRMGWKPSLIADNPVLVSLSFEKRTFPRALVLQFLLSEHRIEKRYSLVQFFKMTDKDFIKRISGYSEVAPHVLAIYEEALNKPR